MRYSWSYTAAGFSLPKKLEELLTWLSEISTVQIFGNPWEEPPEAVMNKGMRAVSQYFTDVFAEGVTVRRSMIKVVLVGQEGAGKTR